MVKTDEHFIYKLPAHLLSLLQQLDPQYPLVLPALLALPILLVLPVLLVLRYL